MMKQRWGLDRNVLRPTPGDPWGVEQHHWNTGAEENQQLNPGGPSNRLAFVDILSLKGVKRIEFTRIKVKVVTFIRIKLIRFAHFKLKMSTNTSQMVRKNFIKSIYFKSK